MLELLWNIIQVTEISKVRVEDKEDQEALLSWLQQTLYEYELPIENFDTRLFFPLITYYLLLVLLTYFIPSPYT